MTPATASLTDLRIKMPTLSRQAQKNGAVVLLKKGKPFLGLVDYPMLEKFQEWQKQEKRKKAAQAFSNLAKTCSKLSIGKKWLTKEGYTEKEIDNLSDEDFIAIANKI